MNPSADEGVNASADASAVERPGRLKIGVVGTGRVGAVLGAALSAAGHRLVAASGVSDSSRSRAETMLPGADVVTPPEVLAVSDLALLTVPDDALADLVAGLAATHSIRPGQLLVHTSGRFGVRVLEPATRAGALPLALHPAMTFTGTSLDVGRLTGCAFGVTAPTPLRPVAEALVVEMGGEPFWIEESARSLYHAALAHGSNHLVTLVAQSMDLLREAGVTEPARLLGPLLVAALDNTLRVGDAALTGPVARGDAGTVAEHVAAIAQLSPEILATYRALARATADRALAGRRLHPADAEALLGALAGPLEPPAPPR
jgi:predicted short-subunit dehydrogenase-like oxidoreductase (DUF2520 family)